jgi:hypothetical protein
VVRRRNGRSGFIRVGFTIVLLIAVWTKRLSVDVKCRFCSARCAFGHCGVSSALVSYHAPKSPEKKVNSAHVLTAQSGQLVGLQKFADAPNMIGKRIRKPRESSLTSALSGQPRGETEGAIKDLAYVCASLTAHGSIITVPMQAGLCQGAPLAGHGFTGHSLPYGAKTLPQIQVATLKKKRGHPCPSAPNNRRLERGAHCDSGPSFDRPRLCPKARILCETRGSN